MMRPFYMLGLGDVGHVLLWLAISFGFITLMARKKIIPVGLDTTRYQSVCILAALGVLVTAHIMCDFSLVNVWSNNHTKMPLLYRMAATWGNHQGSLLLLVSVMAGYQVTLSFSRALQERFVQSTLVIHGQMINLVLLVLLLAADPFATFPMPLGEGQGLNPMLQDRALAIHPPLLYLGAFGFSVVYAMTVAGLVHRANIQTLAAVMRPYVLMAWSCLTLGITLGSWWAYYELGWGGWWFWDPVENASLMPWLLATALIHTLQEVKHKATSEHHLYVLGILTFTMSILGTFLVRTGVLTSVHSFALDPDQRIYFFALMSLITLGGGIALMCYWTQISKESPAFLSLEGLISFQRLFLYLGLVILVLSTIYPLVLFQLYGETISIGPAYFQKTFLPLLSPLVLLMSVAPFMTWGAMSIELFRKRLFTLAPFVLAIVVLLFFVDKGKEWLCYGGIFLALLLLSSHAFSLIRDRAWHRIPFFMGHMGFALMILGVTVGGYFQTSHKHPLTIGASFQAGAYTFVLRDMKLGDVQTFDYERAVLSLEKDGKEVVTLYPEKRLYKPQNTLLGETSIWTNGLVDVYVSLGTYVAKDTWVVHVLINPLVPWIWVGGFLMSLGGFVALIGTRRRDEL